MEVREIQASEVDAARRLLFENGWTDERVTDLEQFRALLSKSQRALVAVRDGEVVGFARAICDELSNGYLSMLVVAESQRRKGVGRALVDAVIGGNPRISWMLRTGRPEVEPFYEKLGFVRSTVAMERPRAKQADANSSREGGKHV
jgi:GNAT superfamily N-acetyltransferase